MNYFNRLYALVAEIETNTARVTEAHVAATRLEVRGQIPGGLGSVTVNGESGLESVDLDPRMFRFTNAAALGAAVRQAITEAENEYQASYFRLVADASRHISPDRFFLDER
jgi:DNA-binding protein YbaB